MRKKVDKISDLRVNQAMKAVIQRVQWAQVWVDGKEVSSIEKGLLTLLGIGREDDEKKLRKMMEKISQLRIFEDEQGRMNLSVKDVGGSHLLVSQFTLLADCSRGTRPSFLNAAPPEIARPLYEKALQVSEEFGVPTKGGMFGAHMEVRLLNDGPVTIVLEF